MTTVQDMMGRGPKKPQGKRQSGSSWGQSGSRKPQQASRDRKPAQGGSMPPAAFQARIDRSNVKTPDDLALYLANAVSTSDRPYQHQRWMGDWFAEHLGETRWCGTEPETPVILTVEVMLLAIDHWVAQNHDLRGRQIWPAWSDWFERADFLDEGVVAYAKGTPRVNFRLAELAAKHYGIELDPEGPDFREDLEAALDEHGTDSGALLIEHQRSTRWLGRARQLHALEVEDAAEEGREPRSLESILEELTAHAQEQADRKVADRERVHRQSTEPDDGEYPDEPEDDAEVPSTGMTKSEAQDLLAQLDAARKH